MRIVAALHLEPVRDAVDLAFPRDRHQKSHPPTPVMQSVSTSWARC